MIVWISKYALSTGITKHEAKVERGYVYQGAPFMSYVGFRLGTEAHETVEGAIAAAEAMRIKKIASLKKHLGKLEKMSFEDARRP